MWGGVFGSSYNVDFLRKNIWEILKSGDLHFNSYKKLLPNIDWSRTDVEYADEYVLSQMGLKWNENKDGVEKI